MSAKEKTGSLLSDEIHGGGFGTPVEHKCRRNKGESDCQWQRVLVVSREASQRIIWGMIRLIAVEILVPIVRRCLGQRE